VVLAYTCDEHTVEGTHCLSVSTAYIVAIDKGVITVVQVDLVSIMVTNNVVGDLVAGGFEASCRTVEPDAVISAPGTAAHDRIVRENTMVGIVTFHSIAGRG